MGMLKNIDPLLTPDLLYVLRAMGHGDEIVIVDANYPAESAGPQVVRLDALSATQAMDVILTVMPLDAFVPDACVRMEVVGKPSKEPRVARQARRIEFQAAQAGALQVLRTRAPVLRGCRDRRTAPLRQCHFEERRHCAGIDSGSRRTDRSSRELKSAQPARALR
jgi:L-fucose mutarotase